MVCDWLVRESPYTAIPGGGPGSFPEKNVIEVSCCSEPVSRILFLAFGEVTTIPLGPALLTGSSDLPGGFGRAVL